jgi:carboxyl-terminal processing protease
MIRLLFMVLTFSAFSASAQQSAAVSKETIQLKKEIRNTIKKNSLYKDSIDWKKTDRESDALSFSENDSVNQQILFKFFIAKLREVGDKHSFLISKKAISSISEAPAETIPQGAYLGDGIGVIKVPGCMTFNTEKYTAFANTIKKEIEKIDTENTIEGWIVDLRHNTGGNMWPMLAGLNALIEDGTVGYFISPAVKTKQAWKSVNGKLLSGNVTISDYKIKNQSVKIAVLIDSLTGSSGEMTAISLIGLPNVKTFGHVSAGYTTANQTYHLSNGAQLLLASGYAADRTGKTYSDNIVPDVQIKVNQGTTEDEVIKAAKEWLLQSGN